MKNRSHLHRARQKSRGQVMLTSKERLIIPSSIEELNGLQRDYNRLISRFLEAHFNYQICGPTVFVSFREPS